MKRSVYSDTALLGAFAALGLFLAAVPGTLFAQEAAGADDSSTSFSDDTLGASDSSFFDDGSFSDSSGLGAASSALELNGSADLGARLYLGGDALDDLFDQDATSDAIEGYATARLNLHYQGSSSEYSLKLKLNPDELSAHPEDVVDEAFARAFLGDFTLEAGKMKVVWGKGDELHVVDLMNANDYTDFVFPAYIDRRIAEPMVRAAWSSPSAPLTAELVWTPTMTADRIPSSGLWEPSEAKSLVSAATSYVSTLYGSTYSSTYSSTYASVYASTGSATTASVSASAAASAAGTVLLSEYSDASAFLPDTDSFDYSQFGARLTGTIGSVDLGFSYYYGHYKTPSVSVAYSGTSVSSLSVTYDRLQSFGVEAATALGPINLRAEGAYYLTDDVAGDDPEVKNNSLNWLFGFDLGLPIHNVTVNAQTIGSYVLGGDGIVSSTDVDYDREDLRSTDRLVVKVSDSFNHEKVTPAVTGIWGVEHNEYLVMPSIDISVKDDFVLTLQGAWFFGDDGGDFAAFLDNDFVRCAVSYAF